MEPARRAGVDVVYVERSVDAGILVLSSGRTFWSGDVLRARWVRSLDRAGVPLDGIAVAIEDGALSLSFMDVEAFDRFADVTGRRFNS